MGLNNGHEVDGLLFETRRDAEQGQVERKKIQYLNEKMNYANIDTVMKLYDKMLDEKQFRTPIGWNYMLSLRERLLLAHVSPDKIRPIPLHTVFTHNMLQDGAVKQRVKPATKKKDSYKNRFHTVVTMNVLLVLCVVILFVIAQKGETPNIVNYRNNIVNQYAAWEQELTQREQAIREKERELGIYGETENISGR